MILKINLKGVAHTSKVWLNGKPLSIAKSLKVCNHSKTFAWGYNGSGPAQLALAVMLELVNETQAIMHYQDFKSQVLASIPMGADFELKCQYDIETRSVVTQKLLTEEKITVAR